MCFLSLTEVDELYNLVNLLNPPYLLHHHEVIDCAEEFFLMLINQSLKVFMDFIFAFL